MPHTYIQRRERSLAWDRQESFIVIINGHCHVRAHGERDCTSKYTDLMSRVVYIATVSLFGWEEYIKKINWPQPL